jgi:hypothetical protein
VLPLRYRDNICFAAGFAAMLIGALIGAAGDLVSGGLLALVGVLTAYVVSGHPK